MPPIQDVIRFTVREVYDPARRSELLSVPTPSKAYEFSRKHGFSDSITDDYWAAHWVLPAINDLNQMLHRRIIDPAKWKRYVTLNDYEPTMIDNFKKIIYYPYTRVDVRRMYEYGVLESKQVEDTYLDLGYDTEHARNLAIFAKSIVAIPVIKARYSKGWITGNQVKEELLKTGMTATKAEEIYQTIVAAEKTTRVTAERDLTKAEIVKGVKKGVISIDEGVSLLQDMGYDQFESQYILAINLEAASGSPETPFEFKNIIAKYRQAVGQSAEILPENILALERELIAARKELESQKEFKVADELLAAQAKEVSDLEKKLRDELQRIRSTPIPQK
jgi:hypothetical protein